MSSKRCLYHPAPSQTPPPQVSKSLVQGRLITDPSNCLIVGVPQDLLASTTQGPRGSFPLSAKTLLTPSKESSASLPLFSPVKGPVNRTQSDIHHQEPRSPLQQWHAERDVPLPHVQPSTSLSLSDSDDEPRVLSMDKMSHAQQVSEQCHVEQLSKPNVSTCQVSPVLMVNASARPQSHVRRDIPVLTSIVNSQAKVICHSPRGERPEVQQAFRSSGSTREGANIKVESMPRVNISNASVDIREQSPSGQSEDTSVVSVSSIAGSPVDGRGPRIRTREAEDEESSTGQYKSFLGDVADQHEPPLSANLSQAEIRQQLFDYSASDTPATRAQYLSLTTSSQDKTIESKKKKKTKARAVPSRYMSTTAKVSKKDSSRATSSKSKPSASKTQDTSTHDLTTDVDFITPFPLHNSSKSGRIVSSTPASNCTVASVRAANPRDVSSCGASGSAGADFVKPTFVPKPASLRVSRHTGSARKQPVKSTAGKNSHAADASRTSFSRSHAPVEIRGEDGDVSQRQLELEHVRLLQWIFLNSKLKDTMDRQEKEARTHMFSVWQENESLRRDIANLEHEHAARVKNAELERQLAVQLNGLQPIGGNMAKLILQYAQLSDTLDTTRHHMPVDGVLVPSDHESLLVTLDESERLLGEIDALIKRQKTKALSLAREIHVLNTTTEAEMREQNRCEELLSAASTLRTHECSLQAQTIQQQQTRD